jgi:arylsulfatase A-like enzyme
MRTTFALLTFVALSIQAAPKPNVVLIMTDNHGAWTLGCYGNRDIRTPNIDALAKNGVLFDQAYANNPVCSPTRASYLTGLMESGPRIGCR